MQRAFADKDRDKDLQIDIFVKIDLLYISVYMNYIKIPFANESYNYKHKS